MCKICKDNYYPSTENQCSLSQFTTEDDCKNNGGTWTNACTVYCNSSETCNNLGICNTDGTCSCYTNDKIVSGDNCNICSNNLYGSSCFTYCVNNVYNSKNALISYYNNYVKPNIYTTVYGVYKSERKTYNSRISTSDNYLDWNNSTSFNQSINLYCPLGTTLKTNGTGCSGIINDEIWDCSFKNETVACPSPCLIGGGGICRIDNIQLSKIIVDNTTNNSKYTDFYHMYQGNYEENIYLKIYKNNSRYSKYILSDYNFRKL